MSLWPKGRKARRRLTIIMVVGAALAVAVGLALSALRDTVVFFYGPSEIAEKATPGQTVRLGGLVAMGSVEELGPQAVRFVVTDQAQTVPVEYVGTLPDLFREGQGVVAEGQLTPEGLFKAKTILAKHDETYMPREVKKALEASGEWRGEGAETSVLPTTGKANHEDGS